MAALYTNALAASNCVDISASIHWRPWKSLNAFPNCFRSLVYCNAFSYAPWAMPSAHAAAPILWELYAFIRSLKPFCSPPGVIRRSVGSKIMSTKLNSASGIPLSPIVSSTRSTEKPFKCVLRFLNIPSSLTTIKPPIPSSLPLLSNTRAKINCNFDTPPPEIHIFFPFNLYLPSSISSALVSISLAAEPALGSVIHIAGLSPLSSSCEANFFCSCVP
mmetsp:Transcript_20867/g.26403  ORF Transcript_20867/g.26403 Transcript_20867/m.26403 type:complete len:218 (-) Transcript_20867:359-1012(-)